MTPSQMVPKARFRLTDTPGWLKLCVALLTFIVGIGAVTWRSAIAFQERPVATVVSGMIDKHAGTQHPVTQQRFDEIDSKMQWITTTLWLLAQQQGIQVPPPPAEPTRF